MQKPLPYILLIDDDEDDLEMFSSGLEIRGIKVKAFGSPARALFYLTLMSANKELPALIIMDYNMPGKNGMQVLLMLKENKDTKEIPVILYSTGMSVLLKQQLSIAGALDCLSKPWNYPEFTRQVELFRSLFNFYTNCKMAVNQELVEGAQGIS
jgi:response regulator RpfG family c-di-GMP phosphodiesterase